MAIKIGVVGVGVHGTHHLRLLSSMKGAELVGIFDTAAAEAKEKAAEFSTRAFPSLESLLDEVDCVSVAVPTTAHFDVVNACFDHGRPVLVEKPIAVTVDEAERLVAHAKEKSLPFGVGHIERFNSAYRSIAGSGVLPVFIESHRLAIFNPRGTDVAVVLDLMIHDIDIVLDMVGRAVQTVQAVGVSVVSDAVDIANARLEFEGGCVANLTASRISQKKLRKIRTFQRNAYISMDFLTGESEVFTLASGAKPLPQPGVVPQLMEGISYSRHPNDGKNALEIELADFIGAVERGGDPRVPGAEGTAALEVAARVMKSMESSLRSLS